MLGGYNAGQGGQGGGGGGLRIRGGRWATGKRPSMEARWRKLDVSALQARPPPPLFNISQPQCHALESLLQF